MGKRGHKKIKKLKPSQKLELPKYTQEIRRVPSPHQQGQWPPRLPQAKFPIGSGNPNHGRPLYDPVFPTRTVPAILRPRYPIDWRNGGRAMLCMAMATIEGVRRLWRKTQIEDWQTGGYCSERCGHMCGKSHWRLFCGWRIAKIGFQQHLINVDSIVNSYKGPLQTKIQSFLPPPGQARRNATNSVAARWDPVNFRYQFVDPENQENFSNLPESISQHEPDHALIGKK